MKSFVTTKKGDSGTTRLLSGEVVPKDHPAVMCTGELDTLRAELALLRLRVMELDRADAGELGEQLLWVLHVCFLVGTEVNDPKALHPEYRKEEVGRKQLERLERYQAELEAQLRIPRKFIVSATNLVGANADRVATLTRKFERQLVSLKSAVPEFQPEHLLRFTNRLSDYLVVLARHVEDGHHLAVDYTILDDAE